MIRTRCPICDRLMESQDRSTWPDFPFCSSRCRLIDLGRWLGQDYRIAEEPEGDRPAEGGAEENLP